MKILCAHTYYQRYGGEDAVFESEARLLAAAGVDVVTYVRRNSEIETWGLLRKAGLYFRATNAADSCRDLVALAARESVDAVHFHNTLPLISPGAMRAVSMAGFPVVATIHNYRFSCVNGLFLRNGRACEDCHGRSYPWPGVLHACYRDSRLQSAAVARSISHHRRASTFSRHVDLWISSTEFARRKAVEAGFPPDRVVIKPPHVADPGESDPPAPEAPILFVGRLSVEKGVEDLIEAAAILGPRREIRILGDGPERPRLERLAGSRSAGHVRFSGFVEPDKVIEEIRSAAFLVVPSRFYETFGRVVAEAFSCGRAAIVADHGALKEMVEPGITGLAVPPGDPVSLARAMAQMLDDPRLVPEMGRNARRRYKSHLEPAGSHEALRAVYDRAIRLKSGSRPHGA